MNRFILLLILILLFSCNQDFSDNIPELTGKYKVGTINFELNDNSRNETFSINKNDKRKLLIRVWYPCDDISGYKAYPWIDNDIINALNKYMGIPEYLFKTKKPSRSFNKAPVSKKEKKYPVIIYNHGYGSEYLENFSKMEELASNGYLVFSINHTYESIITVFSDYEKVELSQTLPYYFVNKDKYIVKKNLLSLNKIYGNIRNTIDTNEKNNYLFESGKLEIWKTLENSMDIWIRDNEYLIKIIKENNLPELIKDISEINNIGIIGHSFGGIIAGELCMKKNEIKAGINMDGLQINYDKEKNFNLLKPFMFFYSTDNDSLGIKLNFQDMNDGLFSTSNNPAFSITLKRSKHQNFTDLTYLKSLKNFGVIGEIDGKKSGVIQNSYILAFFNKYLKGIDSSILKNVSPEFSNNIILKNKNIE